MIKITEIDILLTYKCIMRCDHCFVWGSPFAEGVMKLKDIRLILNEAKKIGTVNTICFEGGEPFLYYPIMLKGIKQAKKFGFKAQIITDCYWAISVEDAKEWLLPVVEAGIDKLDISADVYHSDIIETEEIKNAIKVAKTLGIEIAIFSINNPEKKMPKYIEGVPVYYGELMYRGRCVSRLVEKAVKKPWNEFNKCPYEDLETQSRVHIDPLGYIHICQGIAMGNILQKPLAKIIKDYNPHTHPIIGPLITGGPVELCKKFNAPYDEMYADACHFCYNIRVYLRDRFPDILTPDQMYGVGLEENGI